MKRNNVFLLGLLLLATGLVLMGCSSLPFLGGGTKKVPKVQPEVAERAYLYLYVNDSGMTNYVRLSLKEEDWDYIQYFDGKLAVPFLADPARGQPANKTPPKELPQTLDIPAGVHSVTVYGVRRLTDADITLGAGLATVGSSRPSGKAYTETYDFQPGVKYLVQIEQPSAYYKRNGIEPPKKDNTVIITDAIFGDSEDYTVTFEPITGDIPKF